MGLFGLFGSKEERQQGALKKLAKKVTERYGPPENRQKAMQQLSDMGTPAALRQMLVDEGAEAIGPIESFVREEEDGIAWALRVLAEIAPADKVFAVAVGELARLGKIYTRDPEKKLVLLTWLREHHAGESSADVEGALLPLLEDFSDDVRITAARALVSVAPGERARDALIQLLLRDRDNARVRGEVLEALAALGADVKGHRPAVEALLVEPFFLDREGNVKKRG
jgi:thioredoxin-like negative regulator of GroEL